MTCGVAVMHGVQRAGWAESVKRAPSGAQLDTTPPNAAARQTPTHTVIVMSVPGVSYSALWRGTHSALKAAVLRRVRVVVRSVSWRFFLRVTNKWRRGG